MSEDAEQRPNPTLPDIRRLLADDELSEDGREQLRPFLLNASLTREAMDIVSSGLDRIRDNLEAMRVMNTKVDDPIAQELLIVAGMRYHHDLTEQIMRSHHHLEDELEVRAAYRERKERLEQEAAEREAKRARENAERKAKAALKKATDEQAAEVVVEKRKTPDTPAAPSSSKRRRRIEPPLAPLSPALE